MVNDILAKGCNTMLYTSRIKSGFDAELQLGKLWFLTAIQALIGNGVLNLPNGITITDVEIVDDPIWDLDIVTSIGVIVKASMVIANDKLEFKTNFNNVSFSIDMPDFGQLARPPVLQKIIGGNGFENVMGLLFNLNIRASAQSRKPLPRGEHLERGSSEEAVSFLPNGQHIALGLPRIFFVRSANNIWHTELRDKDGSHPLPAPSEERKGEWQKVKASVTQRCIKYTLEGKVPIDFWPDADVTLDFVLKPKLNNGKLTFAIDTDLDVDTGFWGDLLSFTIGALASFLITIFTGGFALIPNLAFGSVIVLEVGEYVVGEVIERRVIAKGNKGNRFSVKSCNNNIVQFASPRPSDEGISLGVLDAIPSSIPILTDSDDPLYSRMVVIAADFDEIALNGNGLAVAGKSIQSELLKPRVANIVESVYSQDELRELKYRVPSTGKKITLSLVEVLNRLNTNELRPPVEVEEKTEDLIFDIPAGKLCCPCLTPTHIRRENTVITRIRFDTGLELNTQDAVMLQEIAGVYLQGLQLIYPRNGAPYFRAPANETKADNFEMLPEF